MWLAFCRYSCFLGILVSCGCLAQTSNQLQVSKRIKKDVKEAMGTTIFENIDKDSDGMIEGPEIAKELGNKDLNPEEIARGVRNAMKRLDANKDQQITESDFYHPERASIETLLTPSGVANWVKYAVQLPKHAKAFENNNINWLDFSVLMQNDGEALKTDLGIESLLNRQKLIKSMMIVMLGSGKVPLQPTPMCKISKCDRLHLKWKPDPSKSLYPVHQYRLQMLAEDDDDDDDIEEEWQTLYSGSKTHHELKKLKRNTRYQFRVQGWNQIGNSPFHEFNCKTKKHCTKKKKKTRSTDSSSSSGWLMAILETVFQMLLLIVSGVLTFYGGNYFFPRPERKVPKQLRQSWPSPRQPEVQSPAEAVQAPEPTAPSLHRGLTAPILHSRTPPRLDLPPSLDRTPSVHSPWEILTEKREMEKKEQSSWQSDSLFKTRVVWVDNVEPHLLGAHLNWSRPQNAKKLRKKKKRMLIKNVFAIDRKDTSMISIRYKTEGLIPVQSTLTLRSTADGANDWFDKLQELHGRVTAAAEAKRVRARSGSNGF